MLDHVFTDAIGAMRDALESALLERQAFEERFHADVLLGDVTWETSYGLPGEGTPPRVQVDITLEWPTWSQTAYRTWYIGETFDEPPRIEIGVVLRIQRLGSAPDPASVLPVLPPVGPELGGEPLHRSPPTVETLFDDDLAACEYALEVSYAGSYELSEAMLADGSVLDQHFAAMGGWISATLVRVGDLTLDYLPAADDA